MAESERETALEQDVAAFWDAEREHMQPTLLIGLGGTGKIILTRLKARFLEHFGRVPPRVKLLLFDIDPAVEVASLDGSEVTLSADEFVDLGNVPVGDIKRTMRDGGYPEFQTWFDKDVSLAEDNLRRGGQQNRQLGRLALFWHLRTRGGIEYIENAISDLTRMTAAAQHGRPDSDRPMEVNVFIISSLCGGTGSGMLIDVAYLTQSLFEQRGMKDTSRLIGVLITPKIFRSVLQENIQPNALAALQELDYFMTRGSSEKKFSTLRFLGGTEIPCVERPFRVCYLIDAISSGGRSIEGIENAAPMLVDGIFLQVGSRLGVRAAGLVNNVKVFDPPTVYSSFGVASLIFPARLIIGICAARAGQEVIRGTLLSPLTDAMSVELDKDLNRFFASHALDAQHLFDSLSRDEEGRPAIGQLTSDDRLRQVTLTQVDKTNVYSYVVTRTQEIGASVTAAARRSLEQERDATIRTITQQTENGLINRLTEIVNSPQRGLAYGREFLARLRRQLDELTSNIDSRRRNADQSRVQAEQNQGLVQQRFEKAARDAQRWILGMFTNVTKPRDDFIRQAQRTLERQFEVEAYAQARRIVDGVVSEVIRQIDTLETLIGNLGWIETSYLPEQRALFEENIDKLDVVRRKAITTDEDIDEIYETRRADATHKIASELVSAGEGLYALGKSSREEVADRVFSVARKAFGSLLEVRLEDVISDKADEVPPEEWMKSLRADAETFWSYRKAVDVGEDMVSQFIQITGVENTQESIFSTKAVKVGEDYATTGDKHAITVLRMEHGFPYASMSQFNAYLTAYRRALAKSWPVHIFPEFNFGDRESKRVFILAYAHGFISKYGTEYLYGGNEGSEEEISLGSTGLRDAVWQFVNNQRLVEEVDAKIKAQERAMAREEAGSPAKALSEFAGTLSFRSEDVILGDELTQILRQHIRMLERA